MGKFSLSKMVGIVFAFCAAIVIASRAQTLTTLVNFDGGNGANPYSSLIQATDGSFYGTTQDGGTYGSCPNGWPGCGTVFRITAGGTLTTLHSFEGTDGAIPSGALVQATDGNLYGTTQEGGASGNCSFGCGTIFKITPSGTLTTLHSFDGTDGSLPVALVQATDGKFYGTTNEGGTYNAGTVFKVTPSGTLTTLHSFDGTDGSFPGAGLIQATDGNFYGTTFEGGAYNLSGTVFKITPAGTLTTLYSFCAQPNCSDGSNPIAGLAQATDGNFYGTTQEGGASGVGTVFKITPSGTLTTLHSFDNTDGAVPVAGLLQATDGNFYGATAGGGAYGNGTVFKISAGGTLTTLHSFSYGTDGKWPSGLVQATNRFFYGTTESGGAYGDGTVFSLSQNPQFVPVTPCRLVDTRPQSGGGGPIQGGTFETFNLPQLAQTQGCANLSSAASYSLNVTLVPQDGAPVGYLTIWPAGENQPYVSTMNSPDGRIKANAAIVPAGVNGGVSVYVTDTANVILDIDGYFATAASGTYQFYPLTPCRLVDTRGADGDLGGPRLATQTPRSFPLLESNCIPTGLNPLAYSLNFTVVPNPSGQPLGYLSVWPTGETQPIVSTLNNPTATVVANAAIVPAGTNGAIDVYAYNTTDLLVDIDGYFAAPGTGGLSMYPVSPCRVLDTRQNNGQPFGGEKTVNVVGSACAPPGNAAAYIFNATVVPPGSMPYLTLWPDGEQQPVVSTLNAYDGFITSNMAIVPTTNGSIDAWAEGPTQLILDISGYFAP